MTCTVALMGTHSMMSQKHVFKNAHVRDVVDSTVVTRLTSSCTELMKKFIIRSMPLMLLSILNGNQLLKSGGQLESSLNEVNF